MNHSVFFPDSVRMIDNISFSGIGCQIQRQFSFGLHERKWNAIRCAVFDSFAYLAHIFKKPYIAVSITVGQQHMLITATQFLGKC